MDPREMERGVEWIHPEEDSDQLSTAMKKIKVKSKAVPVLKQSSTMT
jgi:hypothetical protein